MNARIFSIAGAAALMLGATMAHANPFEGDQAITPRAEVVKAAHDAMVAGKIPDGESFGE